jgi:hypothetical protein
LVGRAGKLFLLEIKDGAKSPSKRQLTPAEVQTLAELASVEAPAFVVHSVDEALRAVGL